MPAEFHSFDAFEADQKKRFWSWLAIIFIGMLVLAVAGWYGRSAFRHFKEKNEASQAQVFLARSDYRNAVLSANQALILNPNNVSACRVMAEVADLSHSPTVLELRRRIAQTEPTIENKLLLAGAGLRYQNPPFPLTAQILDELAPVATNRSDYHVVAATLALSLHRLNEAEAHFESAAGLEPTNQLFQLNLATLRLGGTNEAKAADARRRLEQLQTDKNLGAAALRALVVDRLGHQDFAAANAFSTQLLASAQVTLADQLQQLRILKQIKSDTFDAGLQALEQSCVTSAPAASKFAAWMQANGLLAESIPWLTNLPASIRDQTPVRLALADGYMQSADWRTLRDFASRDKWGDAEFLRLAILSRAWSQLDMKSVADSSWSSAITEASDHYGDLTALLGLAEQWNWRDQREVLLQRIVERFPEEHWAQQALAQAYFTAGKTVKLHQLYERLFSLFPKDESFENNLAATALLLKINLREAGKWAAEVHAESPNNPDAAATYAFALHLQGRDHEGLAVMEKLPPNELESPSIALYYGLLLASTRNAHAAGYLEIARTKGLLLPEEQQLLQQALSKR